MAGEHRLKLSNSLVRSYAAHRGWRQPEAGKPFLLALRHAVLWPGDPYGVEIREGTLNHWDDALFFAGTLWRAYPCTTDPGLYYTKRPSNPEGAAWLVPGTHRFTIGRHKSLWKNALVQAEALPVRRDRDRDGRPEYGELLDVGWFGIHIHQGGSLVYPVGKWSAGCIAVPQPYWSGDQGFWPTLLATRQVDWDLLLIDGGLLWDFSRRK